jgi:fumarate hydratase subunit beta
MDIYTPRLFEQGVVATIGKGERSDAVAAGLQAHGAVYFCAPGGCGALAAKCVTSCAEIAFADLGCESIKRLTIKDFLLIVAMDCQGGNLFAQKGGTHVT